MTAFHEKLYINVCLALLKVSDSYSRWCLKFSVVNCENESAKWVAYVPGQIWSRGLKLFMITRFMIMVKKFIDREYCTENIKKHFIKL